MHRLVFRWIPIALLLVTPLAAQGHGGHDESPNRLPGGANVPLYDDLGNLHHEIGTSIPLAQRYFDQGLRLTYGFNHAEAIASYRQAVELDSTCAMCYWGIAWAYGPNINGAMDSASGAAAFDASRLARRFATLSSPKHQAFIEAMARRYRATPLANRAMLDSAYARAMGDVASRYPDDPEAQVLHAEALMLLSPWDYWDADNRARPGTATLLRRLAAVMERSPDHPGACHFYIHAVEAAYPERALPCAERLPGLMPGAGHIVHMPAHVYIRIGRYTDAIDANVHAVQTDEQYIGDRRPEGVYPLAYYPHNYHFLEFAAQMAGQSVTALHAARQLADKTDKEAMRVPGLEALQHFLVAPLRVMVRFGKWDEILSEAPPPEDLLYPMGTWHWARGLAFVRKNDLAAAQLELDTLTVMAQDASLQSLAIWGLNGPATLLEIASLVLRGELASARGDHTQAVDRLRRAVRLEDGLLYDEPPTWEVPVRHFLGAALLQSGQAGEAETVYRQDLIKFPENGWSLFGLREALLALGNSRESGDVQRRFRTAWQSADVTLTGSRY